MIPLFLLPLGAGGPAVVTVSGHTITHPDAPGPVTAGLRFTSGGIVEQFIGTWIQIDSATDWIQPNGAAGSNYSIRLTVSSGTSPSSGPVGSWESLGSTVTWELTRQGVSGAGSTTGTYLVEISSDGGSTVIDSASYTLTATIIP